MRGGEGKTHSEDIAPIALDFEAKNNISLMGKS